MNASISGIKEHKLLQRLADPVIAFARRMEQGRLDLFAPEQIVDRLYARLDAAIDRIPRPIITTGLIAILRDASFWNGVATEEDLTPQVKAFCGYFRALDAHWPYASSILIMDSRYVRRSLFADFLRAMGYLQRASSTHQEHCADWLRHASGTIIESLYYELVSLVYSAECLRRRKPFAAKRGGAQLQELAREAVDSFSGLFLGSEGRIRNAAAHYDRWRYSHASNSIHLTDKGWSHEYSTTDLLEELRSLLQKSMLPFHVIVRQDVSEARLILRALLMDDPSAIPGGIEVAYNRTADELRRLGWTPAANR